MPEQPNFQEEWSGRWAAVMAVLREGSLARFIRFCQSLVQRDWQIGDSVLLEAENVLAALGPERRAEDESDVDDPFDRREVAGLDALAAPQTGALIRCTPRPNERPGNEVYTVLLAPAVSYYATPAVLTFIRRPRHRRIVEVLVDP